VKLTLAGVSHHRAPIELRERVALDLDACRALAHQLGGEAVVLSTCNRTELYLVREEHADDEAVEAISQLAGDRADDLAAALYRLRDEAAALHLFRVAAGLDSLVPGEGEILGQVRAAFEAGATARSSTGSSGRRCTRQAGSNGDRDQREPGVGPSAAAALAQQVFGDLQGTAFFCSGPGRSANPLLATSGHVVPRSPSSRTGRSSTARILRASSERGHSRSTRSRVSSERADVVVSATSAAELVLSRESVAAAVRARKGRPLLLLDLAVPRDLDPAINELDGCFLYDVDDLEAVVTETLSGRRAKRRAPSSWWPERPTASGMAGLARHRPDDRVAPRARGGDPRPRAPEGRRQAVRAGAQAHRIRDLSDRRKAPAFAHDPSERGSCGSRWSGLC
jgi:glutamyl-tRNA reductase